MKRMAVSQESGRGGDHVRQNVEVFGTKQAGSAVPRTLFSASLQNVCDAKFDCILPRWLREKGSPAERWSADCLGGIGWERMLAPQGRVS